MDFNIIKLEKIITRNKDDQTPNGVFIPVWRNWDSKYNITPDMVYYTTIPPGLSKGPHLHKKRRGYITCLTGKVVFILKNNGTYSEYISDSENPFTIEVPPGTGLLSINIGEVVAGILNICNPAWHPNEPDNYLDDFSDYNIKKWNNFKGK